MTDRPSQLRARALFISVDRSKRSKIGRQVEENLRQAIRSGLLTPGSALPSTRALADDLGVSRGVIVRAYAQLASEGYLELRQGVIAHVRDLQRLFRGPKPEARNGKRPTARYDLSPQNPELSLFPRQSWLRSLRRAVTEASTSDLSYSDAQGLEQLRIEIGSYLGRARGVAVDPDCVIVTAGTTHSLSLISRALSKKGTSLLGFENPSHRLLHRVARSAGLTPVGVAVDCQGVVVEALRGTDLEAVVITPAHQFPTGVSLSSDRRTEITRWAREASALLIEDDYDAEFRYDRSPVGALQGLSPERIAYLGSTGKTLAPGIRLAWAVLPSEHVGAVVEELSTSVLNLSGIDQLAFADFLHRGEFDRHLRRMRTLYRQRRDALIAALAQQLPQLTLRGIAAGIHVLIELPSPDAEAAMRAAAEALGIRIETVSQHALPGYEGPFGVLIGYGGLAEPAIPYLAELLARAADVVPS